MQPGKTTKKLLPALFTCVIVASAGLALSQSAIVRSAQPITVSLSGAVERQSGKVAIEKAGSVNPGEIIHYTITSTNAGPSAAHQYKAVGPIPIQTVYVEGSANAEGASVVYSIDRGKSFSSKPMIEQRQPDGSVKTVPAPVSMYTHLRFDWPSPFAPDSHCSASYQVRVK